MLMRSSYFPLSYGALQDLSLVVTGSSGRRKFKKVPYTQFFVTAVTDEAGEALFSFVSLQPVSGPEAEPSQTMVSGHPHLLRTEVLELCQLARFFHLFDRCCSSARLCYCSLESEIGRGQSRKRKHCTQSVGVRSRLWLESNF